MMPTQVPTLGYNPNTETHWSNQLVNFHDCLYEFRENTEFIAFPDWDDLMQTPGFEPMPSVFQRLASEMPNTAAFSISRYIGYALSLS